LRRSLEKAEARELRRIFRIRLLNRCYNLSHNSGQQAHLRALMYREHRKLRALQRLCENTRLAIHLEEQRRERHARKKYERRQMRFERHFVSSE
jgi:hypothetical protein